MVAQGKGQDGDEVLSSDLGVLVHSPLRTIIRSSPGFGFLNGPRFLHALIKIITWLLIQSPYHLLQSSCFPFFDYPTPSMCSLGAIVTVRRMHFSVDFYNEDTLPVEVSRPSALTSTTLQIKRLHRTGLFKITMSRTLARP